MDGFLMRRCLACGVEPPALVEVMFEGLAGSLLLLELLLDWGRLETRLRAPASRAAVLDLTAEPAPGGGGKGVWRFGYSCRSLGASAQAPLSTYVQHSIVCVQHEYPKELT